MTTSIQTMYTDDLWDLKEFDRQTTPAPAIMGMYHNHTVEQVSEYIKIHGTGLLELSVIDNGYDQVALLTDGNHRLAAARNLGVQTLSVEVKNYTEEEATEYFQPHVLERFKPCFLIDNMTLNFASQINYNTEII